MSFSQIVTEIVKELDRAEPQIRQLMSDCVWQGYGHQPEQPQSGHHGHHKRHHGCRRKNTRPEVYAFCPVASTSQKCPEKCSVKCPEKCNQAEDYQVGLDVKNYASEEINVKTVDNFIVVEGKQDEKEDELGSISRNFVRRYRIPEEYNIDEASSVLSADGILSIRVPLKVVPQVKERVIPIQKIGKSHIPAQEEAPKETSKIETPEKSKDDSTDFEMVKDNLD
uniref:Putative alpha crystallin n=1 Tax=Nyssomyia neivai TaxID=330878 RepID=A0A1L8DU64_9DIPT